MEGVDGYGERALEHAAVDRIPAMVAYWDAEQRCRFANRAYEQWFDVSPEWLIGRHISELLGALYPLNLPYIEGALRGDPQSFEREIPDPSGGPPRHSIARYMPDEVGGVVRGFFVLVTDVSELKRAERQQQLLADAGALLASSLDISQTLKTIAELIVRDTAELCVIDLLDEEHNLIRLTVTSRDPAKAAACDALARLSIDWRNTIARSAIETRQPQLFEDINPEYLEATAQSAEHLALLRELSPRSSIVVPMLTADSVLGAIVFSSTQPRRYSQRDMGLAVELARRAALALENARLYEAAQRATRARDDVLAIVAHDVRAPLNSILLAAELLQRCYVGAPGAAEHVDGILRSVQRANHLIQDLLDVRCIEAGALTIACRRVAIRPFIDELLRSQRLQAAAASVSLIVEIDDDVPQLAADPDRLSQVFENLLGNAVGFTPRGGAIMIAARRRSADVLFAVHDTGKGIAPENLPHVFDRFWQASRTRRKGAGLGLPICKGIIEAHGGRIWVESTLGAGTTFFFTLPVTETEADVPTGPGLEAPTP